MANDPTKLRVIVICTPNSNRSRELISSLESHPEIDLHQLQATMLDSESPLLAVESEIAVEASKKIYGRILSPGEFGCSYSNNVARRTISKIPAGGIILEDDARLVDIDKFIETSRNFLRKHKHNAAVLALYHIQGESGSYVTRKRIRNDYIRFLGHPTFTVAYALTSEAARRLVAANTPVKFVADWPIARVRFYGVAKNLVHHGDESTQSTILKSQSDLDKRQLGVAKRLSIFTGWYYLANKSDNFSFNSFLSHVWVPRFLWYVNRILGLFIYRRVESQK